MAVYTQLEFGEIEALVAPLRLGRLIAAEGVPAGVENTTYFLSFAPTGSHRSKYVLTIAETLSKKDLAFVAGLMHDLHACDLPVPRPAFRGNQFSRDAAVLSTHGKPAMLVPKIAGAHPQTITPALCHQIGHTLAELHHATLSLGCHHESHRSLKWVGRTGQALLNRVNGTDRALLDRELTDLSRFVSTNTGLPQAVIHGDLFRDNVLIAGDTITAIIDFFSAGTGYLLLDLAIVVNDWCFDAEGNLNRNSYQAVTAAYCATRSPSAIETQHWGELLRIAALRFWVSRMNEQLIAGPHAPRGRGKSPTPYRQLVLRHRSAPLQLSH